MVYRNISWIGFDLGEWAALSLCPQLVRQCLICVCVLSVPLLPRFPTDTFITLSLVSLTSLRLTGFLCVLDMTQLQTHSGLITVLPTPALLLFLFYCTVSLLCVPQLLVLQLLHFPF